MEPMSKKHPTWEPHDIELDKRAEAQDMLEIMAVKRSECPRCKEPLNHFSGLELMPEFLYCPRCNDRGWNEDGEVIVRLE